MAVLGILAFFVCLIVSLIVISVLDESTRLLLRLYNWIRGLPQPLPHEVRTRYGIHEKRGADQQLPLV